MAPCGAHRIDSGEGGLFADLVRSHRHRLGLTQEALAAESGVAVRTIRSIEAGRITRPQQGTVRLLARAFALTDGDRDQFLLAAAEGGDERPHGRTDTRPAPTSPRSPAAPPSWPPSTRWWGPTPRPTLW
jgi:transcriptional regulator with XRE-family HTH domain